MKKNLLRFICAGLALITLAGTVSCAPNADYTDDTSSADTAEETVPDVEITLYDGKAASYTIIRTEKAVDELKSVGAAMYKKFNELAGDIAVSILDDWVREGGTVENDACEILLGNTNRIECEGLADLLPGYLDYVIKVKGKKICIYANEPSSLSIAVDRFFSYLTKKDDGSIVFSAPETVIGIYDYPMANTTLGGKNIKEAKIVIPASVVNGEDQLAERVAEYLKMKTGAVIPVVKDSEEKSGAEIVIGNTSRRAAAGDCGNNEYTVSVSGGSVFVEAASADGYHGAMPGIEELFEKTGELPDGWSKKYSSGYSLDGKKVMFIGNSMIYYGNCVINGAQTTADLGYFYQLCKANGEKCVVTDCTYGSHGLREFVSVCDPDHHSADHLAQYNLDDYDYVIMCQVTEKDGLLTILKQIMRRFTNPKTKFIYLCCTYTYQQNHTSMMNQLPGFQKAGITVVNVGELCYNVWKGNLKVPGSELKYNKDTFIVNKQDSNHPNMLTGYIEALMVYCAITGRSAVGQPYKFCTDTSINSKFSASSFISSYYNPNTTNFDKVFASETDMRGLQTLVDQINQKWDADKGIPQK